MNLRVRILGVLAVLVSLNALFVVTILWAFIVFLPTVVVSALLFFYQGIVQFDVFRLPFSVPVLGTAVIGVLSAQVYYGYQRVLAGTRPVEGESDHEIARLVRKLAMQADIPEPDVRVVADEAVSCYTVGRFGDATIVLSTGLIDQLDSDELEAVLAHEIAHIASRDVTLMTITTLFLEIANRTYQASRLLRRAMTHPGELSGRGWLFIRFFLPLAALTYLFVAPILGLFPRVGGWATRTLSHAREFAADDGAARLSGKPLALATALSTLAETAEPPETDMREARTQALCIIPMQPVTGQVPKTVPDPSLPAEVNRGQQVKSWLGGTMPAQTDESDTHPSVERRIERLREFAGETR